ncbi:hypothetical protein WJX74_006604 [Apatococcus lobatus]|uniref:MORN repeat protein n=1 Tax=Apatococcus lobatus TaxID=904363 RepID=A0AAW1QHK5_9CHLO
MHDKVCTLSGVLKHSNGDRYEGEFFNGKMHGFGAYTWRNGIIYRGEWEANKRSGCGVELVRNHDGSFTSREGQFMNDTFIGPVMACPASIAVARAAEADAAAQKARAFVLKD